MFYYVPESVARHKLGAGGLPPLLAFLRIMAMDGGGEFRQDTAAEAAAFLSHHLFMDSHVHPQDRRRLMNLVGMPKTPCSIDDLESWLFRSFGLDGKQTRPLFKLERGLSNIFHGTKFPEPVGDAAAQAYNYSLMQNAARYSGLEGLRMFETESFVCLGPPLAQEGDLLCVFNECKFPVLVRKSGDGFSFVGSCHVPGLMNGEASKLNRRPRRFELR